MSEQEMKRQGSDESAKDADELSLDSLDQVVGGTGNLGGENPTAVEMPVDGQGLTTKISPSNNLNINSARRASYE